MAPAAAESDSQVIQGSNTDFLVCTVALRKDVSILTTDEDFLRFEGALRVRLHQPRG